MGRPFSVQTDAGARRETFFSEASGPSAELRAVVGAIATGAARPIAGTGRQGGWTPVTAVAAIIVASIIIATIVAPAIVAAVIVASAVVTAIVVTMIVASAVMAAVIIAVVVASAVMAAVVVAMIVAPSVVAAVVVAPMAVIVPPVFLRFVAFIVVFLPASARRGLGQNRRGDKHGRQRQHETETQYTKQSCHKILAYEGIVRDSHSIHLFCGCVQTGR